MGVDAHGCPAHFRLGQLSGQTQRPEGLCRRAPLPPDADALGKIGLQGCGAGLEGKEIHIAVAAAVLPVHQARLGGNRHLIQQGLAGIPGRLPAVRLVHSLPQNIPGLRLELFYAVLSAPGADLGAALNKGIDAGWLQLRRNGLDGQRLGIHQQNTLVARLLPDLFKIGNRNARNVQLPQQQPLPEVIAAADQGAVFDGACNVHREADHRPPAFQQLPLPPSPLLPGL